MGPRTGLDSVRKRKIPSICRESNGDVVHLVVAIPTKLSRLTAGGATLLKFAFKISSAIQLEMLNYFYFGSFFSLKWLKDVTLNFRGADFSAKI
jgi:hypothetical protein